MRRLVSIYLGGLRDVRPSTGTQPSQRIPVDFSTVEKLSIITDGTRGVSVHIQVFRQAAHLRRLEIAGEQLLSPPLLRCSAHVYPTYFITVPRHIFPNSTHEDMDFRLPPLSHIHPASLSTLTHLTVHSCATFHAPHQWFSCPYTNIVDDTLALFVALKSLRFGIVLQGVLNPDPDKLRAVRWGRLPDILTTPGACPKLNELAITVQMRAPYQASGKWKEDAEIVGRTISEVVYPAAFRSLLEQRPEITLSFSVEVSARPLINLTWLDAATTFDS